MTKSIIGQLSNEVAAIPNGTETPIPIKTTTEMIAERRETLRQPVAPATDTEREELAASIVDRVTAQNWKNGGALALDRDEAIGLIKAAISHPVAPVVDGYYLASFKRGFGDDGGVIWWAPENKGYTTDLEQAGVYTEITHGYHDSEYTVPVPVSFVRGRRLRQILDPGDLDNRAFRSAFHLRAALEAALKGEK